MKRSLIFGGGALAGGAIFRTVLVSYVDSVWAIRRSGELFPCCIDPRGIRAGIFDGVRPPAVEIELVSGFRRIVPGGVFAPDRGGGGGRIALGGRE